MLYRICKVFLHSRYLSKINGKITIFIKPWDKVLLVLLCRCRTRTRGKDFCLGTEVKIFVWELR